MSTSNAPSAVIKSMRRLRPTAWILVGLSVLLWPMTGPEHLESSAHATGNPLHLVRVAL